MIKHRGLRHLALVVADVERAKSFYARVFGMKPVWEPDADNCYLSSGCDNLAIHRGAAASRGTPGERSAQNMDHLGFIVATLGDLEAGWTWAEANGIEIVHALRKHRDGSSSFYVRDPDGNVVQVLYEPAISPLDFG